ncbi:FtsH protease activity modulator HflK [Legionella jordanis]|uniref:Protein HflK n=1 Tax=Legionella jordanis TaxID=456 RepID=A0A0W0VB63_9GAMM|nr:FtsH protease activity modulator HflK [Legionella jordanis]KTD17351.1 protease subunit HflK [Legionella jordanis]RMX01881.1 FtsH protease activity modulator HflK [Legionella jordanis]RMX17671.1 FtsH protease activity modulator HflK [Legionella jordanis]VEH11632.1 protease subunit HflK [Legionella jordanis]
MGWNEPDKGKDPWSGKNQPPDLDEALKRFQEKLKRTFFGGSNKPDKETSNKKNAGFLISMAVLIVFILWVLSGIFIVDPAEQAVILRFGKYVETVGPGPHWIPRIIESKIVQDVDRVSHYSYTGQMLTKDENLVSVSVIVQYRIGDLENYLFNVANPEESLQQATSSALRQVIGTTTFDQIITEGREAWGNNVQDTLTKTLDRYKTGIVIVNVSPQPARAPEDVQDAFDDAMKAREDEKRFKEQALAYQARVVPIAQGNAKRILQEARAHAQQVILRAKGEVAEFLALLPQYTLAPAVTSERMYLESMQQVLSKSSKIIVDNKSGNLLYLPLEKLLGTKPIESPAMQAAGKKDQNTASNENSIVGDRTTRRRTYQSGGND